MFLIYNKDFIDSEVKHSEQDDPLSLSTWIRQDPDCSDPDYEIVSKCLFEALNLLNISLEQKTFDIWLQEVKQRVEGSLPCITIKILITGYIRWKNTQIDHQSSPSHSQLVSCFLDLFFQELNYSKRQTKLILNELKELTYVMCMQEPHPTRVLCCGISYENKYFPQHGLNGQEFCMTPNQEFHELILKQQPFNYSSEDPIIFFAENDQAKRPDGTHPTYWVCRQEKGVPMIEFSGTGAAFDFQSISIPNIKRYRGIDKHIKRFHKKQYYLFIPSVIIDYLSASYEGNLFNKPKIHIPPRYQQPQASVEDGQAKQSDHTSTTQQPRPKCSSALQANTCFEKKLCVPSGPTLMPQGQLNETSGPPPAEHELDNHFLI